jgi:Kef-type K+ transport system membrane component KefB
VVGLQLDLLHGLSVWFFLGFLAFACAAKGLSVYLGARLGGENSSAAVHLAVAMNARGGPGIVLASVAFAAGVVNEAFYATLVMLAIVTSLVAGTWLERVPWDRLRERPEAKRNEAPAAS